MLVVSNDIKNAYNQYSTQRKSYIKVGDNSFFIQNLDISADAYDEGNVIGNAISKIAKFDIETELIRGLDEFELFDGIWTGEKYEYILLGTFKLFEEKGTDDFFSSVVSYDKLINFNKPYDPLLTTYPCTLYDLLLSISQQANVELENISITNGSKILQENIFVEGETLKQVLKAICGISGNFAVISSDKLRLTLKNEDSFTLNKYQMSEPQFKRTTWKINQVVLGMTNVDGEYVLREDSKDIEKNGVHKLVINDNPFVYTSELRQEYIDELFEKIKGFGYISFETTWESLSYVELGDIIIFDDGKESLVLRYNLKSPDGLNSTLSAPSIIDSVVEYVDNSDSFNNRLRKTEYIVDKINGEITSVVTQTEELNDDFNTLSTQVTQNEQSVTTSIQELTKSLNDTESKVDDKLENGVEILKNTLVTININGISVATNISKVSTLITNNTFAIKSGTTNLAYFGYDEETGKSISEMDNLTIHNYFTSGYHRTEKFEPDGELRTGVFFVGGDE